MAEPSVGQDRVTASLQPITGMADIVSWHQLAKEAAVPNPFFEPQYLVPVARHMPELAGMRVLVCRAGDSIVGVVPFQPSAQMGGWPVPLGQRTYAQVALGEPLAARGYERAVAESTLETLLGAHGNWLRLAALDARGTFVSAVLDAVHRERLPADGRRWQRGFVMKRADLTYVGAAHRNLKRLRRQRSAFERDRGQRLRVIDRSNDPSAVDDFLAMEARGWKGRAGVAHALNEGHAEALHDLTAAFRAEGRLRVLSLRAGDDELALKVNLISGQTVFCYLITFDEAHARLSPGLQLEVDNFRAFHDEPMIDSMDSCANEVTAFANRLYPERRSMIDLTIGSRRLLGRVTIGVRRLSGVWEAI